MILDLALCAGAIIAVGIGYSRGFTAALLSLIGYFGGGLGALYLSMKFSQDWKGTFSIVGLYLIAILIGASLGREVLARIGRGIHKKVFFGPLRFLDSLLGGILSLLQFIIIAAIVLTIAKYAPSHFVEKGITGSKIYRQFSEINLLSFQTSDLLRSISSHLDQLRS